MVVIIDNDHHHHHNQTQLTKFQSKNNTFTYHFVFNFNDQQKNNAYHQIKLPTTRKVFLFFEDYLKKKQSFEKMALSAVIVRAVAIVAVVVHSQK